MKNNSEIFAQDREFTNEDGEKLFLTEIANTKIITSVTIAYLSAKRKSGIGGWLKSFFGFGKIIQEARELTVYDELGILFYFTPGVESVTIRFSSKRAFEQLFDGDYDSGTIWIRKICTFNKPYQFNFHIGNLKRLDWQD
jgi:hypothetical protein